MKKVTILGIPYQIEEVDRIKNQSDTVLGMILYTEQKIKIRASLPKELKEQTLIHEIIHGVLENLGEHDLNNNERLVQSLAATVYQIIQSNAISFS